MSNQTKVTDFFVTTKKLDNKFKGINKNSKNAIELSTNESIKCETTVEISPKTPKRKVIVNSDKSLKSSKRKKTPKSEVIIEFNTNHNNNETNVSNNVSTNGNQLTANEVKLRLNKCNNLLDLKKQLSTINDCAKKVKQFKEMKVKTPTKKVMTNNNNRSPSKCSPIRPIVMYSPIRTPVKTPTRVAPNSNVLLQSKYRRKLFDVFEDEKTSPVKDDNKSNERLPAFQRFSYLVSKPEENRSLVLPQKFRVLAEMFRSIDYIVSLLHKRQEICTFDKLKDSVERMTRKQFDIKRLAQIQTVYGNAFKLYYQYSNHLDNRRYGYQLIISPIYGTNVDNKLSSTQLLERYQLFVSKLLDITKQYHKKYLNRFDLNINDSDLVRWHPKFKVDDVPDIEPNDNALPVEPKAEEKSAELYLGNTRQELSTPSKTDTNDKQSDDLTKSNQKITKGLLKGLSMDLLNKIRAKEALIMAQEMTRKPEVENEIMILKRLPEFIGIIHSFFIASKKLSIPYDQLINKIIESFHSSLAILETREHLNYLTKLLPDWIYQLEVKRGSYIKINKETSLSSLEDRINARINCLKK